MARVLSVVLLASLAVTAAANDSKGSMGSRKLDPLTVSCSISFANCIVGKLAGSLRMLKQPRPCMACWDVQNPCGIRLSMLAGST